MRRCRIRYDDNYISHINCLNNKQGMNVYSKISTTTELSQDVLCNKLGFYSPYVRQRLMIENIHIIRIVKKYCSYSSKNRSFYSYSSS